MNKLEITIDKADELITALTRLAEALETKKRVVAVTTDEPNEVDEPSEEEQPITSEQPHQETMEPEEEKPVTLEQVRAVLTAKSQAGKKAAIQGLFKRYDADKLTAVDPARYADLLKDSEAL